ncbi:dihydrofolate reductase-like isoform X22 [Dreissena polymorpha]|nr:dihydrofolate reductase-like isoform X22 [Dreissena polymorpha]XP_052264078.1 dihydrofolate reductase-like isoform X22 [Dreissena polymorpha]
MDIMEQNVSTTNGIITFNMMAAMCHNNRGIGYQGDLPWPKLKADFEYYLKTTSTHKKDSSLMIVHVHGRKSWAGCTDFQASYGGVYHIVCSQSRDPSIKTHPNLLTVAGSVPEALEYIADLNRNGKFDSVWKWVVQAYTRSACLIRSVDESISLTCTRTFRQTHFSRLLMTTSEK